MSLKTFFLFLATVFMVLLAAKTTILKSWPFLRFERPWFLAIVFLYGVVAYMSQHRQLLKKWPIMVWHPESPGSKNLVYRTWVEDILRPTFFATLSESIAYSHYLIKAIEPLPEVYRINPALWSVDMEDRTLPRHGGLGKHATWPWRYRKWWPTWLPLKKEVISGCEARGDADKPYLTRWTLLLFPGWKLCYHIFHRSDADDLHDHPSDFWTFPLAGYLDVTAAGVQRVRAFVPYFRKAEYQHRVQLHRKYADPDDIEWLGTPIDVVRNISWEVPAYSFVLFLKRRRDWGFIKDGRWLFWRTYFKHEKC